MKEKINGHRIIAIDPGLNGCGVAVMEEGKITHMRMLEVWQLFSLLSHEMAAFVLIEDSNLGGNWHGSTARGSVGKNKAVSTIILQFLKSNYFKYHAFPPAGYSQAFKDAKDFNAATGWKGKSNKDERAAAAMAIAWWPIVSVGVV